MATSTVDQKSGPVATAGLNPDFSVADMALYGLKRAHERLETLEPKSVWELADTASFDCMHYLGDDALHCAAKALDLKRGQRIIDIGSGFSATGRFLYKFYGADVTGVELQPEIHVMAETINARNGMTPHVRSVNEDFTKLAIGEPVNHIVSFLCILHIPDRAEVFDKAAALLQKDGNIYIEDFFARQPLDVETSRQLRDIVSCPYLPSKERYEADLKAAGFGNIRFEEMTSAWSTFVHARAIDYGQSTDREPSLLTFYDAIDSLFRNGQLGGARIMATKI